MKIALIALNALLTVFLLFALAGHFEDTPDQVKILPPPPRTASAENTAASGKNDVNAADTDISDDTVRSVITANPLFGSSSDNGNGSRRGGATIALVGTVAAGEHSSAVLLIGASRNRDFRGRGFGGQSTSQTTDYSFKQYLRLGETNSAGYKLISVEPDKVVLTRSGERLELSMSAPSQNAPAAVEARNNQSAPRQFTTRDAVAMQMFQNMQMMRIMDRLTRLQQQRTGSSLSGRRGGGSSSGSAGFSGGMGGGMGGGGGFSGGGMGGGGRGR